MEIRGFEKVMKQAELEVGKFYLDPGYGEGTTLFQWIRTGEVREGEPEEAMLVFAAERSEPFEIQALSSHGALVKMPPVSIRVDPPSAMGSSMTKSLAPGMFAVEDARPILAAKVGYRNWLTIDLSTGRPVRPSTYWVTFSRWSLVVDEAGEEIVIAAFGAATVD